MPENRAFARGGMTKNVEKRKKRKENRRVRMLYYPARKKVLQKALIYMQHTFNPKQRKDDSNEEINDNYDGNRYCCNKFQRSTGAESKC